MNKIRKKSCHFNAKYLKTLITYRHVTYLISYTAVTLFTYKGVHKMAQT